MGKDSMAPTVNDHDQAQQQQNLDVENPESPQASSRRSRFWRLFTLACIVVLLFSIAVMLSAIFLLFPRQPPSGFDADVTTKRASIQAYFKLRKPASEVISHKERLEHDISQSIHLSNTKVTILSIHHSGSPDYTDVEFAVLPDANGTAISEHSLTSLRSTFVKLFGERLKLNLTTSGLGKAASFQVLKFPGGITVDDPSEFRPRHFSGGLEFRLNFTLQKSIFKIRRELDQLKDTLEQVFISLDPCDHVYAQLTNQEGSTVSPPVIVQTSMYLFGYNPHQKLDSLARIIRKSSAENLGLDKSVFGDVKNITFSTHMDRKYLDSADSVLAPAPSS
ncbi:unnamed protein product [Microthlaspi erraticum]|uniref:DUF7036 domain-containing protein n=1 Tax=Microthlaspi erraticum TaxID=1685480 RepID=A0A6D2I5Z1_9BRAS|nr:unnamed protein product [Microthlaspi erraticum]CAA7050775.1 unnamed protein product [Microthlaspi erraticum]